MKIGLVHVFCTYDKEKNMRPLPFGIGYIASYLLEKGHQVEILDLNTTYLKKEEIIDRLKKMNCDIFGISSISGGYSYAKKLINIIIQIIFFLLLQEWVNLIKIKSLILKNIIY